MRDKSENTNVSAVPSANHSRSSTVPEANNNRRSTIPKANNSRRSTVPKTNDSQLSDPSREDAPLAESPLSTDDRRFGLPVPPHPEPLKKVLILADLFPPAFGPRMGYLCKYIQAFGWQPEVVAEEVPEQTFRFLAQVCPVTYLSFYTAPSGWRKKLQWGLVFLLDILGGYKNRRMYKEAEKKIRAGSFDAVLCSTYRTFPLPAARRLARRYGLPLVTDMRDIIEQYTGHEFISHPLPSLLGIDKLLACVFRWKSLRSRNRALRAADFVTTVSAWHVETLNAYNPNIELIYNGFDPDLFYPEALPTQRFTLTYTGRLLSTAMRDPGLLFEALAELEKKRFLSPAECRVCWYVDEVSRQLIQTEAEKAGVGAFMEYKGYVPAQAIPRILNASSVLLLLTNKSGTAGPKGVMTTKFFESVAVGKPILCVRSDEGCLEAAIRESNAGVAARNSKEVCQFLETYYRQWKQQGYTSSAVRPEVLKTYSRREQAGRFAAILDRLVASRGKGASTEPEPEKAK